MNYLMMIAIAFPIIWGACLPLLHYKEADRSSRNKYALTGTLITSALVLLNVFIFKSNTGFQLIQLTDKMSIVFDVDALSCVFLCLIAILWPLAVLYAGEYMHHEGKENKFFSFYLMTYGIVIGLACSANLITFYLLYECLTFATIPLVMHAMNRRAIKAGRKYFMYSIAGAATAFVGIMFLVNYGTSLDFIYGGTLDLVKIGSQQNLILFGYILTFFGFGVKAAVFPFHGWLPSAGVAPTPVTALLHAVAVVKAGVFAIMRVTYYSFGAAFLSGTWAQSIVLSFACFTIVFGSVCAWKQQHLKKRFAYSTISNLSYILLGVGMMNAQGLCAGLAHMLIHGIMKICLFFCVGVVMEKTHREYVPEIEGMGRVMPITFGCFTIGSLSLSGIPLFAGFISKAALGTAAVSSGLPLGLAGLCALLISAVLTAAYTFEIVIKAFFPSKGFNTRHLREFKDPSWQMKTPLIVLSILMILIGLHSTELMNLLSKIAMNLM
ncbi:MAG: hypothetical protein J6K75_02935 [Erysipelotrichaceae bacterium]|nr:hypothetical protein [Erysipelotrichaceae bacterium]